MGVLHAILEKFCELLYFSIFFNVIWLFIWFLRIGFNYNWYKLLYQRCFMLLLIMFCQQITQNLGQQSLHRYVFIYLCRIYSSVVLLSFFKVPRYTLYFLRMAIYMFWLNIVKAQWLKKRDCGPQIMSSNSPGSFVHIYLIEFLKI